MPATMRAPATSVLQEMELEMGVLAAASPLVWATTAVGLGEVSASPAASLALASACLARRRRCAGPAARQRSYRARQVSRRFGDCGVGTSLRGTESTGTRPARPV